MSVLRRGGGALTLPSPSRERWAFDRRETVLRDLTHYEPSPGSVKPYLRKIAREAGVWI